MSPSVDELMQKGKLAQEIQNYEGAIAHYSLTIEQKSTFASAYQQRAEVYQLQGNAQAAYADYTQAIKYCPENYRLYEARAEIGATLGKNTITTDKVLSLVYLALSQIDFDLFTKARQNIDKAQKLLPNAPAVIAGYVILGARNKRHELIETYFEQLPALSDSDSFAYIARAYVQYNNQEFANMLSNVDLALETDPYFVRARVLKGILFQLTERMEDAIKSVTRAIEIYPQFALAYDVRAGFYQEMNRKDEAYTDADTLLQLDTANPVFWHRRAILRLLMNNPQGALADCEATLALQPNYAPAYITQGLSLARQSLVNNSVKVIENLTKAIELAPSVAEHYYYRAEIYAQLGQKQESIADYERFLVLHRSQQVETGYITRNLMRLDASNIEDRVQRIIAQLRAPVETTAPTIPPTVAEYLDEGETLRQSGRYEDAEQIFAQVLDIEPNNATAYANLAAINWMLNDYTKAYLCVEKALELNPGLPLYHLRARLLSQQENGHAQAIRDYNKLIASEPDVAVYYYERGNLYLGTGQFHQAIEDLGRALAIDSHFEDGYFLRGTAYGKLHDYPEAMADMQQVLVLNPKRGEAYFFIGYILRQMGEKERCVQSVEKALEIEPYHPNAKIWRQQLARWKG